MQENIDSIDWLLKEPITLRALKKEASWESVDYRERYAKILEALVYDDAAKEFCGEFTTEFVSKDKFLTHDDLSKSIKLIADDPKLEAGVYDESYLIFTVNGLSFELKIEATIFLCLIEELKFAKSLLRITYEIGTDAVEETLPEVVQKPDCEKSFTKFRLKSTSSLFTQDQLAKALTLDLVSGSISVGSDDISLAGGLVTFIVAIDDEIYPKAETLKIEIAFVAPVPEFDMSDFSVDALTCG